MGRRAGSVPCWYWYSQSASKRTGWFFASEKAAIRWRDSRCYKYVDHGSLEHFLQTVMESSRTKERLIWIRHRDTFNDLLLKKGTIKYE